MSHFVAAQATTEELTVLEDLEAGLLRNKIRIFGATICHTRYDQTHRRTDHTDALEEDRPTRR
jgi:hypothetical protein